ncbi:chitobiase/beta-hexosaminidase C-terminal domain-containing protein [Rheinheimera baltica]|uniref:chitobiase/beta-hexosaminidase C-terminal domain-containing protein n=1 Tax=Rheinheimera baltica TaxID=67576 RepID=UPI0004852670|nr:chitobiase/beta-hexosaminidase C-terminal domain-containing protein [Rheinheimera baltica]
MKLKVVAMKFASVLFFCCFFLPLSLTAQDRDFPIDDIPTAAEPVFSPPGGNYLTSKSVTVTSRTPGATIRYTLNNTAVTSSSAIYSAPLLITKNTLIRARTYRQGFLPSEEGTATINILTAAPSISPNGGNFVGTTQVSISAGSSGQTIRYTTNNTSVSETSPIYTGPFQLTASATVRAKAYRTGYNASV